MQVGYEKMAIPTNTVACHQHFNGPFVCK